MSARPLTVDRGRRSDAGFSPGPLRPLLEGTEVHLWLVDLAGLPGSCAEILNTAERDRAAAIVSPLRRRRWVAARAALRRLLGRYMEGAPGSLPLVQEGTGPPRLEHRGAPHFSLSHSGRGALFAFCAAGAVGVDIETRAWSPMLARATLAARLLGAERAAELSELDEPQRALEFLRAWVAHEANLKCAGNATWSSDIPLPSPGSRPSRARTLRRRCAVGSCRPSAAPQDLDSLTAVSMPRSGSQWRRKLRGAAARVRASLARPTSKGEPAPGRAAHTAASRGFARTLGPQPLAREASTVTSILYGRLSEQDVLDTEQLIRDSPGAWGHYFGDAPRAQNNGLVLALGMWLGSELLSERTGLIRAEPPEDVHAMTRGAQNAAGGLYEANMVIDALLGAGGDMAEVSSALDFGCSSGRVVKPLAAAYPDVRWRGCDPNEPAVAWARENLPGIDFFANGNVPPLPLAEVSWTSPMRSRSGRTSSPPAGALWFAEMHRVIAPGGHLVMTTHGPTSVAHYMAGGQRSADQSGEILEALYRDGWWYAAEFGEQGDWGVVDPEWGTAFVSPEWVLAQLCPRWRVLEYAPGAIRTTRTCTSCSAFEGGHGC